MLKMIPDESSVTKDKFGCLTINVTSENLQDFPALMSWIRQKGYGGDTGLLKLRLCPSDRNDKACVKQITKLMKKKFNERQWDEERKSFEYVYNPSIQIAHKVSPTDHIYQYSKVDCTADERQNFVERAVNPLSYRRKNNCCTSLVTTESIDQLRQHVYTELGKRCSYLHAEQECTDSVSTVVYGDGIMLDEESEVAIAKGFTLSKGLDTVLHLLDKKYDGIANPYYYCGDKHTYFPWHIEDGGLFSINYVFTGSPKLWFGISPRYFGYMDKIGSGLRVDLAHSACRAFLVDHKILLADPDFFKVHCQVPYTQVIQEPGDFVITFPYALHSGFNLGRNLAVAANFADIEWIEWGMYAPICTCNSLQIHFDLSRIIEEYRPELLDSYQSGSAIIFPKSHPREVQYPSVVQNFAFEDAVPLQKQRVGPKKMKAAFTIKDRTLYCPACKQSFQGNKLGRLKLHITKNHSEQEEELLRVAAIRFPGWEPKMTKGLNCSKCQKLIRGDKNNLRAHMLSKHR